MKNSDNTVWITGASKGIGNALVHQYLENGYTVIATSRSISWSDFPDLNPDSSALHIEPGDLSQKEENQNLVKRLLSHYGPINTVILNAGTCEYLSVRSFTSGPFERLLNNNVLSIIYSLEILIPALIHTNSTIALTGSLAAYAGLPRASAYGASKAALHHIADTLQIELAKYPLHLTLITPGFVDTPLTQKNDFNMPYLISAKKAATIIYKGIQTKKLIIQFPLRFSLIIRTLALIPQSLRIKLLAKKLRPDD